MTNVWCTPPAWKDFESSPDRPEYAELPHRPIRPQMPRHARRIDESDGIELRCVLQSKMPAVAVSVTPRDSDDAPILAEAMAGLMDVVVTGDRDLHELKAQLPFLLANPRGFWERLRLHAPQV